MKYIHMVSVMKYIVKKRVGQVFGICCANVILAAEAAEEVHREDRLEEIVVTAPFQQTEAQTALPIGILSGEALREKVSNSLGDTLKNEIGVASASFGSGVGHPVIRGQTGNRVSILQNGVGVTDASNVSPDHAEGVEAILAERLEVIRGPSTLLYGSGAVGGVVNVIDNRIPERLVEQTEFMLDQSYNSVNEENKTVVRLDAATENFGFHLDAFRRESDNVEINGFAIDEAALEALEQLLGEHEEDHEEELENTNGFIGNSDGEANGTTTGFSWVKDNGFIGLSISDLENTYGLPPGTHSHAHHDEEEEEGEEEVEFIRIDMEKTRYDLKGMRSFQDSWIDNIRASIGFTDYEHREIEIFEDGARAVGTLFSNEGAEGRLSLTRTETADWTGVWGLQFSDTEFSAIGEEAFIPRVDISSLGLFGVERYYRGNFTAELGVRVENNEVDPASSCNLDATSISMSGSVLYDLNPDTNLLFGLSRSQRAPTVEELYSNIDVASCARRADDEDLVLHAATALLEIGNPLLDKETSKNIEFGLRRHSGPVTGELSLYYNQIDDFIYLDITGEDHEEQPIAGYFARDVNFRG
ncbi:MAG: TonB-dependent receptor, partial [Gammaproteobacteria bacterium]